MIKGELVETLVGGRGILPGEKLVSFGKDVVVAAENISAEDFHVPAEEFYGGWKAMDEVLEKIDPAKVFPLMKTVLNSIPVKEKRLPVWKVLLTA